jgi:hypothetical protein
MFLNYSYFVAKLMYVLSSPQKLTKLRCLSPRANYTTERAPLVGEVSANFLRIEGATWPA